MAAASSTSRKRSRNEDLTPDLATSCTAVTSSWSAAFSPSSISPAPLTNSRYRLAGGPDTPNAAHSSSYDGIDASETIDDLEFRRGRPYEGGVKAEAAQHFGELPIPLARESNGRPREYPSQQKNSGWSKTVYNTVTGVAGKMWDFCRGGSSFRGFFAGSGQGYRMESSGQYQGAEKSSPAASIWIDVDRAPVSIIPGTFPETRYNENYLDSPSDFDSSQRASKKKKQTHADDGALNKNWVLVNDTPPRRKVPAASTASPASVRRPASRAGAYRPVASPAGRPASAAGLRSPVKARYYTHSRTSSHDSAITPRTVRQPLQTQQPESPIAKETAKFVKDVRRREKEDERELKRFNKRLQDMIKEGKEALGSRVEVEMDDDEDMW